MVRRQDMYSSLALAANPSRTRYATGLVDGLDQ
jgi:hypothetical protein